MSLIPYYAGMYRISVNVYVVVIEIFHYFNDFCNFHFDKNTGMPCYFFLMIIIYLDFYKAFGNATNQRYYIDCLFFVLRAVFPIEIRVNSTINLN